MIDKIFEEIRAERQRQDEKWGERNLPMLGERLLGQGVEFPSKEVLEKQLRHCHLRCAGDDYSWFDILLEEICEAFLENKPEKQRAEMIQVAAVAVAIIEYLDRRMGLCKYC